MTLRTVHPFPARMASELVEQRLLELDGPQVLLDPMMGSGTFVISAAHRGHHAIGLDSDPLTHVIVEAATGGHDSDAIIEEAARIVRDAARRHARAPTNDAETARFIDFWFDPCARRRLSALAGGIERSPAAMRAPLWCAFSRMIITKDSGVSRARDVSHSRPHRVRNEATIDPIVAFPKAVRTVLARAPEHGPSGSLTIVRGDARYLPLADASVTGIMTSPPYLVAIDYLRGHRLSLVWMGYTLAALRQLRARNIGTERGRELHEDLRDVRERAVSGELDLRMDKIINTYLFDLNAAVAEVRRALRPSGAVTFVVANAQVGRRLVSVEEMVRGLGDMHGLEHDGSSQRSLPRDRRYLPPPGAAGRSLDRRMRSEVVMSFRAPAARHRMPTQRRSAGPPPSRKTALRLGAGAARPPTISS